MEKAFRRHAALRQAARGTAGPGSIALDGNALHGSFHAFHGRAAALVLASTEVAENSSEIPAVQKLLTQLNVPAGTTVSTNP